MEWILQIPILFFSVVFHEFAHGMTAFRKGDDTAYLSDRLTLNPLPHIDPIGTILLPALCIMSKMPVIGWAKPVPVNPLRMASPRRDMALVALSGPASNLLLVLVSLTAYKVVALGFFSPDITMTLLRAFGFAVMINLGLAMFNLIPIFPLDGSQILMGFLPDQLLEIYEKHLPYGMYIILGLMITGAIKFIILPPMFLILMLLSKLGFMPLM